MWNWTQPWLRHPSLNRKHHWPKTKVYAQHDYRLDSNYFGKLKPFSFYVSIPTALYFLHPYLSHLPNSSRQLLNRPDGCFVFCFLLFDKGWGDNQEASEDSQLIEHWRKDNELAALRSGGTLTELGSLVLFTELKYFILIIFIQFNLFESFIHEYGICIIATLMFCPSNSSCALCSLSNSWPLLHYYPYFLSR